MSRRSCVRPSGARVRRIGREQEMIRVPVRRGRFARARSKVCACAMRRRSGSSCTHAALAHPSVSSFLHGPGWHLHTGLKESRGAKYKSVLRGDAIPTGSHGPRGEAAPTPLQCCKRFADRAPRLPRMTCTSRARPWRRTPFQRGLQLAVLHADSQPSLADGEVDPESPPHSRR